MLCPCSFNESKLYTLSPKCKPWAYIRGLVFGRIFGLVYRGLIVGGLYSGFYDILANRISLQCSFEVFS